MLNNNLERFKSG